MLGLTEIIIVVIVAAAVLLPIVGLAVWLLMTLRGKGGEPHQGG